MIKEIMEFWGEYRLTGIKKYESRDGYAWNSKIYRNGVEIGTVEDRGQGGPISVFVTDPAEMKTLKEFAVKQLKGEKTEAEGLFLAACCDYEESIARLRRAAKTCTLYRISEDAKTDENGVHVDYRKSKIAFTDDVRKQMQDKLGISQLVEILNDEIDKVPVVKAAAKKALKR